MKRFLIVSLTIMMMFSSALTFNTVRADETEETDNENISEVIDEETDKSDDEFISDDSEFDNESEEIKKDPTNENKSDNSQILTEEENEFSNEEDVSLVQVDPSIEINDYSDTVNAVSSVYKTGKCGETLTILFITMGQ